MVFYMIRLNSFPDIRFAHSLRTDKYKNIVTHRKNYLELSLASKGFEAIEGDRRYVTTDHCLNLVMPDMNMKLRALDDAVCYMTSVAIEADFSFERFETDDPSECRRILLGATDEFALPRCMELGPDYAQLEALIRKIIFYHPQNTVSSRMKAVSVWCELIGEIDHLFRRQILDTAPERLSRYYSRKVQKHIESHYAEPVSVRQLAEYLKISPNYLSSIFKKETGQTITDFTAQVRISAARRLLYEKEHDLDSVAKAVGVSGRYQLNVLFNRYYGTSIQKCILADREITLYHQKPWDVEPLNEDIFDK